MASVASPDVQGLTTGLASSTLSSASNIKVPDNLSHLRAPPSHPPAPSNAASPPPSNVSAFAGTAASSMAPGAMEDFDPDTMEEVDDDGNAEVDDGEVEEYIPGK